VTLELGSWELSAFVLAADGPVWGEVNGNWGTG